VSNVSHELRTPLASIRGMAETLWIHGESDPDLRERYLPRIVSQTDRLARLATQLLDLAQIESGNLIGRFEPVSLQSVVADAMQDCASGADERGVRLVDRVPPDLPPVRGDRDRLVQVFLNLVDNAIRYTPEDGSVEVAATVMDDAVQATVRDTGEGIPEEELPHIFERFFRVDRSRSRRGGGTGLGLSIVRDIVHAHQGSIRVDSVPGEGTCFRLVFPLLPADEEGTSFEPPSAAGYEEAHESELAVEPGTVRG
jgi:signal transduction histidine kinase